MPKQAVKQEFENNSMEVAREALGKNIARWTVEDGPLVTAIPDLLLSRRSAPTQPMSHIYEPSICLIAQGTKRVLLGEDTYVYDVNHFLVTSVDLPTVVQVIKASREKPCLSLMLKLDQREISQLMVDSNLPPPRAQKASRGMAIGEVTLPLLTAFQRLIDLLAEPRGYSDPCTDYPAGNPLPSARWRSGSASAPDGVSGKSESTDSAGNRLAEG